MRSYSEEKVLSIINRPGEFSHEIGITVTSACPERAEGVLDVCADDRNPLGTVHGGCLYTLADTVAGTAVCAQGVRCVTSNGTMEFLRPAAGTRIRCVATPKKHGHLLSVMQVELTDDRGQLVATGTFTFCILHPEE